LSTISQNNIVVNYVITSDQIAKTKTEFDKLTDAEKKAVDETKKLNDSLKKTGQEGGQSVKNVGNEMNNLSGIVKSGAGLLAGFFALSSIKAFTERIVETTIKFEGYTKAIEFGSGSAENFARNQEFLTNLINKYGLGLAQTTEDYKSFFTASTLAGQSQQETNRQFEAVTKAGTVLKLTTDQMQGAFLALGQMMSKGTVQAEELRGQLGERIPGAFSIMAKALGVNERQLNKMLEQGQVLSKDALPKFAAELEKTFGQKAEQNLNGMVNSQNRFNNAIDGLILSVGNKLEPFLKGAYDLAAGIANELAKVGEKAKEQTAENIGLKRAESEIAKALIKYGGDYTVKNAQFLRQQEAIVLLMGMEERIAKQSTIAINAKIAAAGSFNTRAKVTQERAERELAILRQEEEALTKIAGLEIDSGKKKKELTDAELKALKDQYDAKLKLLELDRKQRELQGTLANDPNAKLAAEISFLDAKATLQTKYAAKGLAITKQEIDITKKESQVAEKELNERFKIQQMEQYKVVETTEKEKEKARKASMDQTVKDNKEMIDAVNKEADDLAKKEFDRIKKIEEARQEANQQAFDLAVFSTNAIFDIQSQYAANDFARKQKQFDEEIRLADGNIQKETEINEKRAAAEKEYRLKEFRANQVQSVANAVFAAAPYIIKYSAGLPITAANLSLTLFALAAQTTAIMAQPPPEFAEGTKGKKYKGRAIVGEQGTEKVVTQSGRVYYTPAVATLAQFDEPVEIIPNHQLGLNDRKQLSLIYGNRSNTSDSGGKIIEKLSNIEIGLKNMPVAAISLDERGFMKKVRTPNRSTTILNNRFKN
jgi:tape measure domain-containing protein